MSCKIEIPNMDSIRNMDSISREYFVKSKKEIHEYFSKNNDSKNNDSKNNDSKNNESNNVKETKNFISMHILDKLCFNINDNNIIFDYKYFKNIVSNIKFDEILENFLTGFIVQKIKIVLVDFPVCNVHINLQGLTLLDIDKYSNFIGRFSTFMKITFPDKLDKCILYNAPYIFSKIYNLLSYFIDKKTQEKILLYEKN